MRVKYQEDKMQKILDFFQRPSYMMLHLKNMLIHIKYCYAYKIMRKDRKKKELDFVLIIYVSIANDKRSVHLHSHG